MAKKRFFTEKTRLSSCARASGLSVTGCSFSPAKRRSYHSRGARNAGAGGDRWDEKKGKQR
jgi:hypothetical protein